MTDLYLGIDVQLSRGSSCAVIDSAGSMLAATSFDSAEAAAAWIGELASDSSAAPKIGIDAPRQALPEPRTWHWNGRGRSWRKRGAKEEGHGRHCDVVVSAHRLANPQWTPLEADAPRWMQLGFDMFAALAEYEPMEVSPTASYRSLRGQSGVRVDMDLADLSRGPKDMLNACVAAATVREYVAGRGEAVGGGDGLGAIILPRPITAGRIDAVFEWPSSDDD